MLRPTTHFEQVPLEIVQQIIEKQSREESETKAGRNSKQNDPATRLIRTRAISERRGQS